MIFVALIPVTNYNAQIAFKKRIANGDLWLCTGQHEWPRSQLAGSRVDGCRLCKSVQGKGIRCEDRSRRAGQADWTARAGRCADSHAPRPLGAVDSGLIERFSHGWRAGSWLPQSQGHLGRYHDATRQAHADSTWRTSRVRERAYPSPHRRRQEARYGPWREIWAADCANTASTAGGYPAACQWRSAGRCSADVQRLAG